MDALHALHKRTSVPKLTEPAPAAETLENIYKAAFRAADHAVLRPWRFLVIKGNSRDKLGQLFADAASAMDPSIAAEALKRMRMKPLRAPVIIVSISCYREHPKVPELEQDLSAAAATQNMLVAAYAQGIGAFWRTGSLAYNDLVKQGLGLKSSEKIIGFLYLGKADSAEKNLNLPAVNDYFVEW